MNHMLSRAEKKNLIVVKDFTISLLKYQKKNRIINRSNGAMYSIMSGPYYSKPAKPINAIDIRPTMMKVMPSPCRPSGTSL